MGLCEAFLVDVYKRQNQPSEDWLNDVDIFSQKYLKGHPLFSRIRTLLFQRKLDSFSLVASCLRSVAKDRDFIDKVNGYEEKNVPTYQAHLLPKYDVFLSQDVYKRQHQCWGTTTQDSP